MSYTAWMLITAGLVGLSCGLVGVFLILRKTAMMADAISHTVLLGIVLAFMVTGELVGIHMLIGALLAGWLTAFLVQWFQTRGVQQEASIGIVFTTLFAIGVILISTSIGNAHLDIRHALMGEITFVPFHRWNVPMIGEVPSATLMLFVILIVVIAAITLFYKEWKITSFDPALAASLGIPVLVMHYAFMGLLSLVTVASFDAVGAILVVAMLITPAATAYLWTDKLHVMLWLSGILGVVASLLGYAVALWLDTSISASMAFTTGLLFLISFFVSPRHGLVSKWRVKAYS
ncbi:metal ABC transporter permease [Bacillaceae bacterium SIJ1]|uniref:metal ABC transporter permease n=1 Tax=Litoribacterium kuwaitense TaxID=1398745 RepID=UPI0013EC57D6|nr:metal ABC transporter permease [Litoribacterium kuwaitense]NGP44790.1 metal ABC transporter permease [Litoribacterium kuwaitense]